jgi:hypothetical protein
VILDEVLSKLEVLSKPEFIGLQHYRISCVTLTNPEFERISELARFNAKRDTAWSCATHVYQKNHENHSSDKRFTL